MVGEEEIKKTEKEFRIVPFSKVSKWDEANARHEDLTEGLDDLAASIKQSGLLQPPTVQEQDDGTYKIIMGQRRYLAVERLGWTKIPVLVVKNPLNTKDAKVASLSENLHRRDVNSTDLASACKYLKDQYDSDTKAAKVLGITVPTFRKYLGEKRSSYVPPAE